MQYFSLNTNVNQLRIGRGVSKGIGKELGRYIVSTMEIPWNIIKNDMGKSPEEIINVTSVEKQWIEDQIKELPEFDTIVGIPAGPFCVGPITAAPIAATPAGKND